MYSFRAETDTDLTVNFPSVWNFIKFEFFALTNPKI